MLITILVVLVVVGVLLWAAGQLPLDPVILNIIRLVAIVGAVLYLLRATGLLHRAGL